MQQWFKEHLLVSLVSLGGGLVFVWRVGILQALWRAGGTIVRAFRETELRSSQRECADLKLTVIQLRADLQQEVRINLAFNDINKQDRATIRTLVAKIDQHNAAHFSLSDDRLCLIDYSDVHEEVKRSLGL